MIRAPLRVSFGGGGTDYEHFIRKHDGVALNMAITKYVYSDGSSDVVPGSGLGGSSALWVCRVAEETGIEKEALAQEAERRERKAGVQGGRQDYWPAVFGGLQWLEFNQYGVRRVALPIPSWLEESLVLVDVGARSDSASVEDQLVRQNDETLLWIKRLAQQTYFELMWKSDGSRFARLLEASFAAKVMLTPRMVTEEVARCWSIGKMAGASGGRLMGAGGGGHMLFVCPDKGQKEKVMEGLRYAGYKPESVQADRRGVQRC